jgi:DNA-binding NarL/FixJ family response regulator
MDVFDNIAVQLRAGSQNLLSKQESIVAAYLIMDYSMPEVATQLCRTLSTIKTQKSSIKRKCNCRTSTKLGAVLQSFLKNHPMDYIRINRSGSYL